MGILKLELGALNVRFFLLLHLAVKLGSFCCSFSFFSFCIVILFMRYQLLIFMAHDIVCFLITPVCYLYLCWAYLGVLSWPSICTDSSGFSSYLIFLLKCPWVYNYMLILIKCIVFLLVYGWRVWDRWIMWFLTRASFHWSFSDYVSERLYWIDAKSHQIESSNMVGGQRITILHSNKQIQFPFAITVFEVSNTHWIIWVKQKNQFQEYTFRRGNTTLSLMYIALHIKGNRKIGSRKIRFKNDENSIFKRKKNWN